MIEAMVLFIGVFNKIILSNTNYEQVLTFLDLIS